MDCVEYFCAHVVLVLFFGFNGADYCRACPCCGGAGRSVFEAQEVIAMPFFSEAQAWWSLAACLICFVSGLWLGWWYSR